MQDVSSVKLTRECEAIQIPAGHPVVLPAGTEVAVTQNLGGAYTVHAPGGLFRIAPKDGDALGFDKTPTGPEATLTAPPGSSAGPVDEGVVWEVLRTCYDPEIPVNIVDLGLVYDMHIEALSAGRSKVFVKMTLTAPGCGMGATIAGDAEQKLLSLSGVAEASVEIVWDPPWHPSMIAPAGREKLGLE